MPKKAQNGDNIPYAQYLGQKFPSNKNDYKTVFQNIGNSSHINPAFLYANSMGEGLVLGAQEDGWQNTQQFADNLKTNPELAKYHYDGARMLGLDNIGKVLPDLISKGYLPQDFQSKVMPYNFITQKNEQTQSAGFQSPYAAIQAQAAYLNMNRDDVRNYAKQKNYNLTPEQEDFFTSSEYNGGQGNMQSMMDSYNKRGYLKDNSFIFDPSFKIPNDAYPQIYNNVAPRIRNAKQLSDQLSPVELAKMEQGGDINIKPSHRGLFIAKADNQNMSVQAFARKVLNNKSNYSDATVKQANFAHNFNGKAQAGVNMTQNPYAQNANPWMNMDQVPQQTTQYSPNVALNPNTYQATNPLAVTNAPQNQISLNPDFYAQPTSSTYQGSNARQSTLENIAGVAQSAVPNLLSGSASNVPKLTGTAASSSSFFNSIGSQGASALGGAATALGAAVGHGGTRLGNTMGAVAPALSVIPGWGTAASLGLGVAGGLVNAIFGKRPEMYKTEYKDTRNSTYNPYSRGISGSTALMESGGDLTKNKAKEILKDGTANGKKLTRKQEKYMGWVAGGRKAQDGTDLTISQVQDMYTPINNTGYLSGSPTEQNAFNIIPSNQITMDGVDYPVMAYPNGDEPQLMMPGQNYQFPNSSQVTEIPQAQSGITLYKQGDEVDLTPQQIKQLSAQGYEFSI